MKLENPWIATQCQSHSVQPNGLTTFLQEQYGQLGEDLILEAVLKTIFVREGRADDSLRYLEVGANHPIQTSNTYLFHRKWNARGVLVEANPQLIDALQQVRLRDLVLNVAVAPTGQGPEVDLVVAEHSELSSVDPGHVASFGSKGRVARTVRVPTIRLDELISIHFADGLDLLSIDIEGLDLQVLSEARLPVRPLCIVAEPSRHYQADAEKRFATTLGDKGYVEVARTEYNLVYIDRSRLPVGKSAIPPFRQPLETFDIFDTLIARHCVSPTAIFEAVERQADDPGFATARAAAERNVEHGEYSIADIYRTLQIQRGYSDETLHVLMQTELNEELANVVPIADNVARLGRDAVLITDMYLPPDAIRALLKAAGIATDLPIIQTSHGKRTGSVWRTLAQAGVECHHLGDSRHSDHDTCLHHGMRPELHNAAALSAAESRLFDAGFVDLPRALRSMRLMTRSAAIPQDLLRLQFEFNLPLLITFAALVRRHALSHGIERVLFAARDGLHLKLFYDALCDALGSGAPATYWHTSRVARTAGDPEYLDYCRANFSLTTLIVDLCGTGASLLRLFEDLNDDGARPQTVLCQKLDDPAQKESLTRDYRLDADAKLSVLNIVDGSFCPNEDLEMLNYVPHGMLQSVMRIGAEWFPVRAPYEFDANLRAAVAQQHAMIADAATHLRGVINSAAVAELEGRCEDVLHRLQAVVRTLEPQQRALRATVLQQHRSFEAQTRQRLAAARSR
ncbi:MAG: FkbM family methyltransferase [Burkholderiaceae bacterium]|nr:FkbM family methyltransferase [Burkholderiaceae bacterium]